MKNIKRLTFGLVSGFLMLGFICNSIPVSAATDKILVTDNDGDNTISIGDKFCLGEECFHVTKNADGQIQALAEYNLYTGYTVYDVTNDDEYWDAQEQYGSTLYAYLSEHDYMYCKDYFKDPSLQGEAKYSEDNYAGTYCYQPIGLDYEGVYFGYLNDEDGAWWHKEVSSAELNEIAGNYDYCDAGRLSNGNYYLWSCENYTPRDLTIKQSPSAISAHGAQKGGPEYPEVANHYFTSQFRDYLNGKYHPSVSMYYDSENNLLDGTLGELIGGYGGNDSLKANSIYESVSKYEDYLRNLGYNIGDIDLLSYNDLADILTGINDKDLIFEHNGYQCSTDDWVEADDGSWSCSETPWIWSYQNKAGSTGDGVSYGKSNLTQYVPEQYGWLYSTTYWLKTAFWNSFGTEGDPVARSTVYNYQFFVDTLGDLCFSNGNSICSATNIGAGIRPVITMAADQFELNRIDISGTVRWVDNSNASKIRPLKSMIRLYRNGAEIDSVEVAKDEDEDLWRGRVKNSL